MFGKKDTNDQNNITTPGQNTPQESGVSIGGYVSPYINSTQDISTSGAPTSTVIDPSQYLNTPSESADPLQGINSPVTPAQTVSPTDNLLDDPNQVEQILNGDGSLRYAATTNDPQSQSVSSSLDSSIATELPSSLPDPVLPPAEPPTQEINVLPVMTQNPISNVPSVDTSTPVLDIPIPEQDLNTVSQLTNISDTQLESGSSELNPEVDLANVITSGDEIGLPSNGEIHIKDLLDIVIEKNASDLHLTVGYPASIRIDSKLQRIGNDLTFEQVKGLLYETLSGNQKELLEVNKEVDLSYQHENKARFRVNAYNERGNLAAAYRLIPTKIRTIEELNLPSVLYDFTRIPQGLFLVTGPTGHGKSTTLAAMLQEVNLNYPKHIVTIEDPIEYVYQKAKALVDQRELGQDTHDWGIALRSILRQDPDVVLIGEMRDFETIQAAITIAETGHLVFATLHTNSAAQSIDRIIDVFPPHQQEQIRTQLAGSLKGILSQRLIPTIGGGRRAAVELMIVNPAIQNLIREGKTYQIDNIISTSYDIGMLSLERSLVKMIREGKITVETAQEYAIRPDEVLKLMKTGI